MTTVGDILDFVEELAPLSMKMEWDHVGLLCGSRSRQVKRVLVALDPFEHICQEAAQWGADLLVTHHPLIFHPMAAVTDETALGRTVRLLCRADISAINAHTNLDCAPGGVNDVLAQTLGLTQVQVIDPTGMDSQGRPWGLLRQGRVTPQPLPEFLALVKDRLGCQGLRYADSGKPVERVAVGGGGCGGELYAARAAGCDTFVTSDVKYNQFRDAQDLGLTIIDAGHFHTENPVVTVLAEKIRDAFPEITVKISQTQGDCMKFY